MIVDPGLHVMGWSRQQAFDYLVSTGRFDVGQAENRIDRIDVRRAAWCGLRMPRSFGRDE
jgi:uncharacterized protein (DUF885 family)